MRNFLAFLFVSISFFCKAQKQEGKASFYSDKFKGRNTASGEKYDPTKLTAAHRKLPFGTCILVTNLSNDSTIVLRINDRGPFIKGRIVDVSRIAAEKLNFYLKGVTSVRIEVTDSIYLKRDTVQMSEMHR
jgi:rare lipoprotein A